MDPHAVVARFAAHLDSALAALGLLCAVLCLGTLFSVSWLVGRARFMADETELGQLALGLFRRRSVPFGVAAFACFAGWVARVRPGLFHEPTGLGLAALCVVFVAAQIYVGGRARRVALGLRR